MNKPRGLLQFHLATLLVGNVFLAGLVLINIDSAAYYSGQRHHGWPFKFIRYDGVAPDSPFLDIVSYGALIADVLLWLTILLVPVVLVESRCRNGKVADVILCLTRFHWIAWLCAVAASIVFVSVNLSATEVPWCAYYECGWPFKFRFHPRFSEISGIRFLVLNVYLAAFLSMFTLVLVQYSLRKKSSL